MGDGERLLEILMPEPDIEWRMIDMSHINVHQQSTATHGGNLVTGRIKESQDQDTFGRGCAMNVCQHGY